MAVDEGKNLSKNQEYQHINQVLDVNWTKMGRPKVTDINYNTVAPFIYNDTTFLKYIFTQHILYYFQFSSQSIFNSRLMLCKFILSP